MDLRLAWRGLWHRKGFLVLVVMVLGCGLGSAIVGFGLYEATILKPVPYPDPDRLVQLTLSHESRPLEAESFYRQDLLRVAERADVFMGTGAFRIGTASLSDGARPERVDVGFISPTLFPLLQVQPFVGRPFAAADASPGAPRVVLLSDALWRQRYGADPAILGRTIRLDLRPTTVIGVMAAGFAFPYRQQLWVPLVNASEGDVADVSRAIGVGRLADGVSLESAELALLPVLEDARTRQPDRYRGLRLRLQPLSWFFVDWQARSGQRLLLLAVLALLVVALANTAGLMLSHSRSREAEWTVRVALGAAGSGRLLAGLAGGVIVGLAGLALALPFAHFGLRWVEGQLWQSEDPSPYFLHLDITPGSAAFGAAAAMLAALMAGVLPVLLPGSETSARAIGSATRATGSRAGARLAGGLVAMQVALSLVIVVVMTVLVQAVQAMGHRDLGITRTEMLTARLSLSSERYPTPDARERFWATLVERLRQLPGVRAVTLGTTVPGFMGDDEVVRVEGAESGRELLRVSTGAVDEHFLSTYGVRLEGGRDFTDRDRLAAVPVAIVDRRFAEAAWPGRTPVGRRLRIEDAGEAWAEVVGVVSPLHLAQVDDPPRGSVLFSRGHTRPSYGAVSAATSGPPYDALPALQQAVQELDPDLPLYSVYSLDDAIDHGHANVQMSVRYIGWLGVCGLLVAAAGLYSLLAIRVTERTREIGVRRAIGAGALSVGRAVLGQVLVPLAVGAGAGLLLAWPVAQSLVAIEPSVITLGPTSFGWAATVLGSVVLLALVAPVARALAIDPAVALRHE
ncbi:MAG: ABC transporter permease [Acidobacteriota bacterium]|nr:ABC transporter permease [Acidobacteriota bacterium]